MKNSVIYFTLCLSILRVQGCQNVTNCEVLIDFQLHTFSTPEKLIGQIVGKDYTIDTTIIHGLGPMLEIKSKEVIKINEHLDAPLYRFYYVAKYNNPRFQLWSYSIMDTIFEVHKTLQIGTSHSIFRNSIEKMADCNELDTDLFQKFEICRDTCLSVTYILAAKSAKSKDVVVTFEDGILVLLRGGQEQP
jgi:hypothetical protein